MKKLLAFLAAIMILITLVSCRKNDVSNVKGKISGDVSTTGTNEEQTEQIPEEDSKLKLGKVDSHTYESEFLNLKITLDDDWYLYTEEEIAELNNITITSFDEEFQEKYENATSFYDLFAQNLTSGETINILFEKVNAVAAIALDENEYMDLTIDNLSHLDPNSGMAVVSCEKDMNSKLGDRIVPSLKMVMDFSGINLYERCFIFKKGAYFAGLTIVSVSEESLDNIISCFSSEN